MLLSTSYMPERPEGFLLEKVTRPRRWPAPGKGARMQGDSAGHEGRIEFGCMPPSAGYSVQADSGSFLHLRALPKCHEVTRHSIFLEEVKKPRSIAHKVLAIFWLPRRSGAMARRNMRPYASTFERDTLPGSQLVQQRTLIRLKS